jgi:ATP-dependent RNA circularization protein (DNA/RNA ligase family)
MITPAMKPVLRLDRRAIAWARKWMTRRSVSIPRTGETELHQMPGLLTRHGQRRFYVTEKLDGFSFSVGRIGGQFVASTRDRMIEDGDSTVFGRAVGELDLAGVAMPEGWIVQGELCGPKIRGNKLNLDRLQLFVFDILTPSGFLGLDAVTAFCERAGLRTVPVLARQAILNDDCMLAMAAARSVLYADTEREGAVFRTEDGSTDPVFGRVSFKVFNPSFPHVA